MPPANAVSAKIPTDSDASVQPSYSSRPHGLSHSQPIATRSRPRCPRNPLLLKGQKLDDGFTDLERDADGRAHFTIEAGGKWTGSFWIRSSGI